MTLHLSDPKAKLLISTSLPGLHPGPGQGRGGGWGGRAQLGGQKHDTRQNDLVGKLRHKGALEERVIREGFLEEVFAFTLEEEKRNGAISCADAHCQLLLARCSGPQDAPKHREVDEAESVTADLLSDCSLTRNSVWSESWAWASPTDRSKQ